MRKYTIEQAMQMKQNRTTFDTVAVTIEVVGKKMKYSNIFSGIYSAEKFCTELCHISMAEFDSLLAIAFISGYKKAYFRTKHENSLAFTFELL